MPPRRSCFRQWGEMGNFRYRVSMPPRRSCFGSFLVRPAEVFRGFNATTAFLLRIPPASARAWGLRFQCHHGVPASWPHNGMISTILLSFNATTAFLLPAAIPRRLAKSRGFNATTAFLLPRPRRTAPGAFRIADLSPRTAPGSSVGAFGSFGASRIKLFPNRNILSSRDGLRKPLPPLRGGGPGAAAGRPGRDRLGPVRGWGAPGLPSGLPPPRGPRAVRASEISPLFFSPCESMRAEPG